jgi:hypothetical protein
MAFKLIPYINRFVIRRGHFIIMCPWYNTSALILLVSCNVYCAPGDPVMFLPPLEVRTVNSDQPFSFVDNQTPNRNIPVPMALQPIQPQVQQPNPQMMSQEPITANSNSSPFSLSKLENGSIDNNNFTFNDLLNAFSESGDKREVHEISRAAENPRHPDYRAPYGYQGNPYGYGTFGYKDSPLSYLHPGTVHYSAPTPHPKLKDPTSLVTPAVTKIANKISGVISFLLSLLTGSSTNSTEISSLKDLIVNGVIKPLLIAKGGLKTLISKLAIPVIALLLINVEVFITIWWLWEDCPASTPPPYIPPRPTYGYK